MIHKNSSILEYYLGDYNRELYGRELINKVPLSQKAIALALDKLESEGILKSKKRGNMKYFSLNLLNPEIKDLIIILEISRKINFFKKNRKLAHIFKNDDRVIGIFGSYVRGEQRKESDIDVFIIGNKLKEDYDKLGKTFDIKVSIKYFSEEEFIQLLKNKNELFKEIVKDHILVFNTEKFINIIWRYYYGFN